MSLYGLAAIYGAHNAPNDGPGRKAKLLSIRDALLAEGRAVAHVDAVPRRLFRSGGAGLDFQKGNLRPASVASMHPFKVADPRIQP